MYSLSGYGAMISDRPRMLAYEKALQHVVHPGAVVVDIGTGAGIFAFLACQMGARHVYAIEPANAIHVAHQMAAMNGMADRITWFQALSTDVSLPEPADVIIADLRGSLPLFQRHLPVLQDAQQRFLAPSGVLIPLRDRLWATVVSVPELYQKLVHPFWQHNPYRLNMVAAYEMVVNTFTRGRIQPEQCLTEPDHWATIDYAAQPSPNVAQTLNWRVQKAGIAHGLAVWFDSELVAGVGFSNAPGEPEMVYGQAFFPWPQPVPLAPGDRVQVYLQANLVQADYVWQWRTQIWTTAAVAPTHQFQQSSFLGQPLSPEQLRQRSDRYTPQLSLDGQIDLLILSSMQQGRTCGDIARTVAQKYPQRFPQWYNALPRVSDLAQRYGANHKNMLGEVT